MNDGNAMWQESKAEEAANRQMEHDQREATLEQQRKEDAQKLLRQINFMEQFK